MIIFFDSANKDFFEYWQGLPRTGLVPDKSHFLPEDVPELLPTITIYELASADYIYFRLSGTALDVRDGFNRTGKNYLDYVAPERKEKASEALWLLAKHPCAMRVVMTYTSTGGLVKKIESIGTPMIDSETGRKFLYYSSRELTPDANEIHVPEDKLKFITILRRDFIDIGAGVPDFQD